MWRFIFIVAIFISAFSIGDAQNPEFGYKCGNGYMQFNRDCRKVVLPYFECPVILQGSSCVEQAKYCSPTELAGEIPSGSVVTTRRCREGFTLDSNQDICIRNVEVESGTPRAVCETGCREKDGKCLKSEPEQTVCADGCTYTKKFTRAGAFNCPGGFVQLQYYFFKWVVCTSCTWDGGDYNKVCPWGHASPIDGICYDSYQPCSKDLYCPAGELKNGKCMETIQRQREYICPSADSQDTLRFRCLQPDPSAAGGCGYADPVPICPDNYELQEGGQKCLSRSTIPAQKK